MIIIIIITIITIIIFIENEKCFYSGYIKANMK